jgi:diguanylate cyclase (GGDEF)-like protein
MERSIFIRIVSMAIVYYLTGKISLSFFQQDSIITLAAFAPEGFALAGALIYGRSILPGIFLGQLLLAVNSDLSFLAAVGISASNTIEAYLAIVLLDYLQFDRHLGTVKDVLKLFGSILFILQPFSAALGNAILLWFGHIEADSFSQNLFFWWFGNVMGQLLFTSTLLLLYHNRDFKHLPFLFFDAIFILSLNYLLQVVLKIDNVSILLLSTLPITLYLATISLSYASTVSVLLAVECLILTHMNIGAFSRGTSDIDNIINLNFFMLSHIIFVLLVGTLFREKNQAIEALQSMAHYDYLTGLPNRHLLRERIHHSVYLSQRKKQKSIICFIDLDGFKAINDTYGHHTGDMLLKEVSKRIKALRRQEDDLLRIGGDEFLLILNEIRGEDELETLLHTLLDEISSITHIDGHPVSISSSIGVSFCPANGTTVKELMEAADNAMYEAKKAGKNRFHYASV